MGLPFTVFEGHLKQMRPDGMTADGRQIFTRYFPGFFEDPPMRSLQDFGINRVQTAGGSFLTASGRMRRFSGGTSLGRGRYYVLCQGQGGEDEHTMASELWAYSVPDTNRERGLALIDSTVDREAGERLRAQAGVRYENFLAVLWRSVVGSGGFDVLLLELLVQAVRMEATIDLRLRHVQDWFCDTFTTMENEAGLRGVNGVRTVKSRPKGFEEMLPVLLAKAKGGSVFHDAVGRWLRAQGTNALIFPSARTNVSVMSSSRAVESFSGWNLVLYAGAPIEDQRDAVNTFGCLGAWGRLGQDGRCVTVEDDGTTRRIDVRFE